MGLYKRTVTDNPYLSRAIVRVWEGASPKQFVFLTYPAKEILYGGSAGGGKSVSLLAAALQFVTVPGYSALLLRRTFPDLTQPKALIPLSHALLQGTDSRWNERDHRWTFPSGASLTFGYLETENDKYRYQGAEFGFIGFDEATQFTETQYTYLFSRLRKPAGLKVPLRMRASTNPGGVGHQWVYDRFINPKLPRPASRLFIPARLEDNPKLDREAYEESLNELDHITRQQLRHGNWEIRPEGNAFKSEWFRYYERDGSGEYYLLGPDRSVRMDECTRFAAADIAGTEAQDHTDPDYTVVQIWDVSPRGEMILVHQWRGRFEIPDVEEKLLRLAWDYDVQFAAVEKNGIGLPVVQACRRRGLAVKGVNAKRDKFARAQAAMIRMEDERVYFPKGADYLDDLQGEMLIFPVAGSHDDQVDTLSLACHMANRLYGLDDARDEKQAEKIEREIEQEAKQSKRRAVATVEENEDFMWHDVDFD